MKVLLINNFFYRKGGSETVFFNTAELLRNNGHDVVFFSIEDEKNTHINNHEYFVSQGGTLQKVMNYFSNPYAAKKLDEVLSIEKPDIAHVHLFWGGISPSIIPILHNNHIPLVHTAHDYRMVCPAYLLKDGKGVFCDRCKGGKFYNCALHRCSKGNLVESALMSVEMYYRNKKWHPAKEIDGVLFVSNFSKNKHVEFDSRFSNANTLVLYNCPNEQVQASLDLQRDTYNSYYLYYGRLSEEKGIQTLIKAFERFPHLNLKIVGAGPLERGLKQYCVDKNLNNIDFLGFKTGKDLYDTVASAKYVCVPSECYENNPMTIVEAYSLATPVIGASIGGISEVVMEGKTGYSFESGSVESLIKAIDQSASISKEEYCAQRHNAYKFGQDSFSREAHYRKLISFYNQLLDSKQ